jgi:hypothetical protein
MQWRLGCPRWNRVLRKNTRCSSDLQCAHARGHSISFLKANAHRCRTIWRREKRVCRSRRWPSKRHVYYALQLVLVLSPDLTELTGASGCSASLVSFHSPRRSWGTSLRSRAWRTRAHMRKSIGCCAFCIRSGSPADGQRSHPLTDSLLCVFGPTVVLAMRLPGRRLSSGAQRASLALGPTTTAPDAC